ncbi:AAA family ATPase [Acidithiobacillus sulfuriphilus]|uniref:ATP-binding protein n=1 Tax=Acidithiobacillus sulfuriphilus TaxID=1867749 RepID=UPI003F5E5A69
MYFKSIEIENIGPVEHVRIEFPTERGRPKPVIIVGENGTGKSILLSHLVNSLTTGKQEVYDDVEVDLGKVYKHRTSDYIKSGNDFSYSSVKFEADIEVEECQLNRIKTNFESELGYTPVRKIWNKIPQNEASVFLASFRNHLEDTSNFFKKQCCLYFPVNRFEEPAWLNIDNLKSKANYSDIKRVLRY